MSNFFAEFHAFIAALFRLAASVIKSPVTLEYARLFADVIKASVWPLAVVLTALMFRNDLRELLRRILKITAAGSAVDFSPANADDQRKSGGRSESAGPPDLELAELPGVSRTPAQKKIELELKAALAHLIEGGRITQDQSVDLLINELSDARLKDFSYRMYLSLFGSQLHGLVELSKREVASISEARALYETAKEQDPEFYGDYAFDAWLNYMVFNELIVVEEGVVRITNLGREFSTFIQAMKLNLHKRG